MMQKTRTDTTGWWKRVPAVTVMTLAFVMGWHAPALSQETPADAGGSAVSSTPKEPDPVAVRRLALADRMKAALARVGDSPGREYANRLREERYQAWERFFRGLGEKPGWSAEPVITAEIEKFCGLTEAGPQWPRPPLVRVPRTRHAPVLDGVLDEAAWAKAATFTGLYKFDEVARVDAPKTTFKILWDEKHLYFAFQCEDSDIIAPDRPRDDHVYNDDCVEMFILPDFQFRTYWEIVLAPNGSIFDSIQCKDLDRWGILMDKARNLEGLRTGIKIRGTLNTPGDTDEGYTVEAAVPFAALPGYTRATPCAGQRLHFMLVRLDRQGKAFTFYAFQPLQAWGHNIWNHAEMELVK